MSEEPRLTLANSAQPGPRPPGAASQSLELLRGPPDQVLVDALEPLVGDLAGKLFGVGLIGAALLAASILPLSTAYSVSEFVGRESALDDRPREAPLFYGTYAAIVTVVARHA